MRTGQGALRETCWRSACSHAPPCVVTGQDGADVSSAPDLLAIRTRCPHPRPAGSESILQITGRCEHLRSADFQATARLIKSRGESLVHFFPSPPRPMRIINMRYEGLDAK